MRPFTKPLRVPPRWRHLIRIYVAVAVLASLGQGNAARALELFTFEPPYLVDGDRTLKDHCLIKFGNEWHIFYIRGEEDTGTSTEDELGHAVSTDLRNWEFRSPAIVAGPSDWDSRNVWAPHVIEDVGGHTMLFTGTNVDVVQRMGMAFTSNPNLGYWNKLPNPVLSPDPVIYEWEETLPFSSFRDPFIFQESGLWHVLHTAVVRDSTLAANRRGAIHHATSTDLSTWTEQPALALHNGPNNAAWHELESIQLRQVGSFWHMTYTETNIQGVQHLRSTEFDSGWDFNIPTMLDFGVAAEMTPTDDPRKFLFTRHAATPHLNSSELFWVIRADTLEVDAGTDQPAIVKDAPLDFDWPVRTGTAFIASPTFGDQAAERMEGATNMRGNGMISSREFYGGPLSGFGSPGAQLGGGATGLMQSRTFTLQGSFIRLLVGGGGDPGCSVSLIDSNSMAVLATSNGTGSHVMSQVIWDVSAHVGSSVFLQIEDSATSVNGYINVDHIEELDAIVSTPPRFEDPRGWLAPNSPNPFNPRTRIRFGLRDAGTAQITIHDARGRQVYDFGAQVRVAGMHGLTWHGVDDRGVAVASGAYLVRLIVNGRLADSRRVALVR